MHLQAKDSQQHQNLEEAGSTLLQPLEGNQPYGHPDFRLLSPTAVPGPQPQKTQWRLTRSLPSESRSLILALPWPCGLWAFRASGCRLCSRATWLTHSPCHPQAPMSGPRPGWPRALLGPSSWRFGCPPTVGAVLLLIRQESWETRGMAAGKQE